MLIIARCMPRIERMISNDKHCLLRQRWFVMFQHAIHVLVVAPWHRQISNAATGFINAVRRVVSWIIAIRVSIKTIRTVDNIIAPQAANGKCVANDSPLWLTVECHHFAQVVDQRGQMEPIQVGIFGSSAFSGCIENCRKVYVSNSIEFRIACVLIYLEKHAQYSADQCLDQIHQRDRSTSPMLHAHCNRSYFIKYEPNNVKRAKLNSKTNVAVKWLNFSQSSWRPFTNSTVWFKCIVRYVRRTRCWIGSFSSIW